MADCRSRAVQAGRSRQDPPQRGGPQPVRNRPDLRKLATSRPITRTLTMEMHEAASPTSTAWPACCTKSRSPASTARASTTTGRWRPTPAKTCSTPATPRTTTPSSWSSALPSSAPSPSIAELLRLSVASRSQRPPPRRQRSPAGHHLDLPRRSAQRHLRADRKGRAPSPPSRAASRDRRQRPAQAAQGRRRPQPHQPVRLHRQQVRVPRRRLVRPTSPAPTRC